MINWKNFTGNWSVLDSSKNRYSIGIFEFKDSYKEENILHSYIKLLQQSSSNIRWRVLINIFRNGEEKKLIFQKTLKRLFYKADNTSVGLILLAQYKKNRYVNISSQKDLECYYIRRGFEPQFYEGFKVFVRKPLKTRK